MMMRVQIFVATLIFGVSCLQWPDAPPPPKQLSDTFDLQKIHTNGAPDDRLYGIGVRCVLVGGSGG
jgi:hypothetical protein